MDNNGQHQREATANGNGGNDDDQEEDEEEEEEEGQAAEGEDAAGANNAASNEPVLTISAVSNLDSLYGLREIGREALCWQLSSAKPGNGVEQIRDQSTDTYWQSDGVSQPHWIQVHFARRVAISHVCLYLDYNLDESYTPKHLSVQVGMTTQDLVSAIYPINSLVELNEPVGWCIIPLTAPPDPLDEDEDDDEDEDETPDPNNPEQSSNKIRRRRLVRTHLIQISVISMHQNGRDTHVRQVQLYGPRTAMGGPGGSFAHAADAPAQGADAAWVQQQQQDHPEPTSTSILPPAFGTVAMSQFSVLR